MWQKLKTSLLTSPDTGRSINDVMLPGETVVFLYGTISLCFIITFLFFYQKGCRLKPMLKNVIFISFLASGLITAFYADIQWTYKVYGDMKEYTGLSTEEKLMKLELDLYKFVRTARKFIDENGYELFTPDTYTALRNEYFLLPYPKRDDAKIIIVINDPWAKYDASTRTFTRGDRRISNTDIVYTYAVGAHILKRRVQ
jgi:hypothetical protein